MPDSRARSLSAFSPLARCATPLVLGLTAILAAPAQAADTLVLVPDWDLFGFFGSGPGLGALWKMLIGFALLVFPLNKLLFQPIFRALAERAERIAGARARSAQLQEEADHVLERYEAAIRDARSESEQARQAKLAVAREEQVALTSQARTNAEGELERARGELERSLGEARATIRASAEGLARAAAEQVLGRAL